MGFLELRWAGLLSGCRARASSPRLLFRLAGSNICGLQALEHDLSRVAQGYLLGGMWDLPGAGIKFVSPALASKFLTTGPPEKPLKINFLNVSTTDNCGKFFISLCILSLYYYSCYVWTFRFHEIITLEFTSPSHIMNKYVPSHIGEVTKILSQFTQKLGIHHWEIVMK